MNECGEGMSQPTRMMGWSWSRADSRLEGEIETWRETLQSYTVQASAALCDSRVVFLQLQVRRTAIPTAVRFPPVVKRAGA